MAEDWLAEQSDAYADLVEDGAPFTFVRKAGSRPDPITGVVDDDFTIKFHTYGIMLELSSSTDIRGQVSGLVRHGEEFLLVAAKGYETPLPGDTVEITGETLVVRKISTIRPGAVPILHRLSVDRS